MSDTIDETLSGTERDVTIKIKSSVIVPSRGGCVLEHGEA